MGGPAAVLWPRVAVTKAWAGLVPQLLYQLRNLKNKQTNSKQKQQLRTLHVSNSQSHSALGRIIFHSETGQVPARSLLSTQDSLRGQSLLQTTFQKRKYLPLQPGGVFVWGLLFLMHLMGL